MTRPRRDYALTARDANTGQILGGIDGTEINASSPKGAAEAACRRLCDADKVMAVFRTERLDGAAQTAVRFYFWYGMHGSRDQLAPCTASDFYGGRAS